MTRVVSPFYDTWKITQLFWIILEDCFDRFFLFFFFFKIVIPAGRYELGCFDMLQWPTKILLSLFSASFHPHLFIFSNNEHTFFYEATWQCVFHIPSITRVFFCFFFIPLCGGDNKQSPMCQFGTHPRLVDVCSISKTLAVSGFGPINNRIRKKKPGPDSATTLYLFIQ